MKKKNEEWRRMKNEDSETDRHTGHKWHKNRQTHRAQMAQSALDITIIENI